MLDKTDLFRKMMTICCRTATGFLTANHSNRREGEAGVVPGGLQITSRKVFGLVQDWRIHITYRLFDLTP